MDKMHPASPTFHMTHRGEDFGHFKHTKLEPKGLSFP